MIDGSLNVGKKYMKLPACKTQRKTLAFALSQQRNDVRAGSVRLLPCFQK
jgi:hypothetical protein